MNCPSPIYVRRSGMTVPCGKCGACLQRNISDWAIRLQIEWKCSDRCYFTTLTYEKDPVQLYKSDLQRFFKRLRKVGFKFSYFALGDYGDLRGRPHYHVIFFSKGFFEADYLRSLWVSGDQVRCRGFVSVSPLTLGRIYYTVRYGLLAKLDFSPTDSRVRPFFLMSKRPALGSSYLTPAMRRYHDKTDVWYYPDKGYRKPLPRYLRNKLFPGILRRERHLASVLELVDVRREVLVREMCVHHGDGEAALRAREVAASDLFLSRLRLLKLSKQFKL